MWLEDHFGSRYIYSRGMLHYFHIWFLTQTVPHIYFSHSQYNIDLQFFCSSNKLAVPPQNSCEIISKFKFWIIIFSFTSLTLLEIIMNFFSFKIVSIYNFGPDICTLSWSIISHTHTHTQIEQKWVSKARILTSYKSLYWSG